MNKARIGVYGMGTMGQALALNIAEAGFDVVVSNRNAGDLAQVVEAGETLNGRLCAQSDLADFVAAIERPRSILFMIPSGAPLDQMITAILPLLDQGDLLIDGGNADFNDTRRRSAELTSAGFDFIGMGVSGGQEGARHGPSIMVGGPPKTYQRIRDIIEAIAARYQGDPCAAHLGPDGAGHFVKTVHNGIEYADMQMIAEVYGVLRDAKGRTPAQSAALFSTWNKGPLQSYLIEITGKVLAAVDPQTGQPMVDVILDRAGQKGTGRWTVIEALKLGQSASAIEAAVGARSWSAAKSAREAGQDILRIAPQGQVTLEDPALEAALLTAKITAYSQGLSLLAEASEHFNWDIDLARVAEIWRAGCIIRSGMLDDIAGAVRAGLPYGKLILSDSFVAPLLAGLEPLRALVAQAALAGVPVPALSASLAYVETMRRGRGTTDLIQAQRDFFGAHGFERTDREGGGYHGPWAALPDAG